MWYKAHFDILNR